MRYASHEAALEAVRDGQTDACYVYTYMAEKFVNQSENEGVTYSILSSSRLRSERSSARGGASCWRRTTS